MCECGRVMLLFVVFQAEDGIRYLVRSRGLVDVYKSQLLMLRLNILLLLFFTFLSIEMFSQRTSEWEVLQLSLIHI